MAYCDVCGNFDDEHTDGEPSIKALPEYQPELYYYWDGDFCEEDYNWRRKFPKVDCMCEVCFDIANKESKSIGLMETHLEQESKRSMEVSGLNVTVELVSHYFTSSIKTTL